MKCPKCGYLGFEDVRRCRNCGYDFSLSPTSATPDLSIRRDDNTPTPLDDLVLVDSAAAPLPPRMTDVAADADRTLGVADGPGAAPARAASRSAGAATRDASSALELPLFGSPI